MNKFIKNAAFALLPIIAVCTGCSTDIDTDAFRAGAIEIKIDEVTSDEIYPTAGDEIDWKMVFVPSPGDIIVNTFWDAPLEVFNVEVGVYDRFGIPILTQKRDTGGATGEVRTFVPESGLHYIKVRAESGQSIYSINVKFESNYDGFVAPNSAPSFEAYDFDENAIDKNAANAANARNSLRTGGGNQGGGSQSGGGQGGGQSNSQNSSQNNSQSNSGSDGSGDAGSDGGDGEGIVLPSAASGGVVLPTAASGGIASSNGQTGATIVRTPSAAPAGGSRGRDEVRSMDQKTDAVSTEKSALKPICADIKGKHKKLEASILSVTSLKKGAQIKLSVGKKDGVQDGAVGDIYVDGKILEGGRFKVDKIFESSCTAITNASPADVKKADRFVVKTPE